MRILFGAIVAVVVALVGLLAFVMVDQIGVPTVALVSGTVEHVDLTPAYTTVSSDGKNTTVQYHPPTWTFWTQVKGKRMSFSRNSEDYRLGERIVVKLGVGRLTGSLFIQEARKEPKAGWRAEQEWQ